MQVAILPCLGFRVDIEQIIIGRDHTVLQLDSGGLLDGIAEADDLVVGLYQLLIPYNIRILLAEGHRCIEDEGIALGLHHLLVVPVDQLVLMIRIETSEVPGEAKACQVIA